MFVKRLTPKRNNKIPGIEPLRIHIFPSLHEEHYFFYQYLSIISLLIMGGVASITFRRFENGCRMGSGCQDPPHYYFSHPLTSSSRLSLERTPPSLTYSFLQSQCPTSLRRMAETSTAIDIPADEEEKVDKVNKFIVHSSYL